MKTIKGRESVEATSSEHGEVRFAAHYVPSLSCGDRPRVTLMSVTSATALRLAVLA